MSDQAPAAGKELAAPLELAGSVSRPMEDLAAGTITKNLEQPAQNDLLHLTAAVWAYSPPAGLDQVQWEIYEAVPGVGADPGQVVRWRSEFSREFTLNQLIKGLVIAKFGHAVEMYRSSLWRGAFYHVA